MRLALLLVLATGGLMAETAEEMVSACNELADPHLDADGNVDLPRDFETGECWGAFTVLQKMTAITMLPSSTPLLKVCAPKESTRTQYIAIFQEYVRKKPNRLSDDFTLVAWSALRVAFPCKK